MDKVMGTVSCHCWDTILIQRTVFDTLVDTVYVSFCKNKREGILDWCMSISFPYENKAYWAYIKGNYKNIYRDTLPMIHTNVNCVRCELEFTSGDIDLIKSAFLMGGCSAVMEALPLLGYEIRTIPGGSDVRKYWEEYLR